MTGTAVASLVCGILGLLVAGLPLGIVAISLGVTAKQHIKVFPQDKGKGLATAGFIIGIIDVVLVVFAIIMGNI